MKKLVISPNAGMCNRFRAMASALLLARLSGRELFHTWTVDPPFKRDIEIVAQMRASTFTHFFQASPAIPYMKLDASSSIDAVFSEWAPKSHWYAAQSTAIQRAGYSGEIVAERDPADLILDCDADTILVESSRALRPSSMAVEDFADALTEIYQEHFLPLPRFEDEVEAFSEGKRYAGLHIRRADHLMYELKAHIRVRDWVDLMLRNVPRDEVVLICSDDERFATHVGDALPNKVLRLEPAPGTAAKDYAFLDFLCLARSSRIFGTYGSSYSTEAARFGGTTIQVFGSDFGKKLRSWVGLLPKGEPALRLMPLTSPKN